MLKVAVIKKLIKVTQSKLDNKVQQKIAVEQLIASLQAQITQLQKDVEVQKEFVAANIDVAHAFAHYFGRMQKTRSILANHIATANKELHTIQDELKELHIEISKYKNLQTSVEAHLKMLEEKAEAKLLDDFNIIKSASVM